MAANPVLFASHISVHIHHQGSSCVSGTEKHHAVDRTNAFLVAGNFGTFVLYISIYPHVLLETTKSHVQQLGHLSQFAFLALGFGMFRPSPNCVYPGNYGCTI